MSNDCWCEHVDIGVGMQKVDHNPLCPVCNEPCPGCGTPGCDMPTCVTCACGGTAGENDHVDGCPNGGEPSSLTEQRVAAALEQGRCPECNRYSYFGHMFGCPHRRCGGCGEPNTGVPDNGHVCPNGGEPS